MRFDAIRLRHIRRFGEQGLALEGLDPGLNVLARPNEFGKTTVLDALRAALFLPARSKKAQSLVSQGVLADPYIELEFSTRQGSYRLQKRFAFGKKATMTRLTPPHGGDVLVEGTAEERLVELLGADDARRGRPGLLWVGQGDGLGPNFAKEQTATMASLVSHDVQMVSGSQDIERVLALAEAALFEIEHKNGKPKGPLADSLSAVEAQQALIDKATKAMTHSEQLKADVLQQRRRVKDLLDTEEEMALRQELESAAAEAQSAQHNRREFGHTEREVQRAKHHLSHVEEVARRLQESDKALSDSRKDLGMAEGRMAEARDVYGMAEAVAEEKRTLVLKAQQSLEHAERDRDRAYRAEAGKRAREDRKRWKDQLTSARSLLKRRQKLASLQERNPIDLAVLTKASADLVRAEAARDAAAAWVRLESTDGQTIALDGVPLEPGQERPVTGAGVLSFGKTTRLVIGQKAAAEPQSMVAQAALRLDSLLRQAGAGSIEEAQRLEAARQEAERGHRDLTERLRLLAPDGIDALAQRIADLGDESPEVAAIALADAEAVLASAREQYQRSVAAETAARQHLAGQDRKLSEQRTQLVLLAKDIEHLETELGPDAQRQERLLASNIAVEAARDALGAVRQRLAELKYSMEQGAAATAKFDRLQQAWDQRQSQKAEAGKHLTELEVRLDLALGDSTEAARVEAMEKKGVAEKQRDRLERRRSALKKLITALRCELDHRLEVTQAPVMDQMRPMLTHLFGEAEVCFDAEWTLGSLDRSLGKFAPDALSGGTREQLALLTRFGFAKLAAQEGEPTPLILDDALIFADDDRVERMFDLLHEVAAETQVLVLTCHERLFARLGGHRLEPEPFLEAS